jgi:NADH:ubiquinone oxidoreductase subunit 5 (subunit L)/multisubunit Na+/H+ antiporter MnhA subunit
LGGLALIGLPPSGAYLAKELLLRAAAETGQWWWTIVIDAGGIFTGAYVLLVLAHALAPANEPIALRAHIPRIQEAAALALALCSLLLGLVHWEEYLPIPPGIRSNPLDLAALSKALWPVLGGAALAILLGRWGERLAQRSFPKILVVTVAPMRHLALAVGGQIERIDHALRQWPAAGVSLLILVLLFGAAMLVAP